jgi:hypothetical protein
MLPADSRRSSQHRATVKMSIDYEVLKNPETTTRRIDTDQQEVSTMNQPSDAHRLGTVQDVLGGMIALRSEWIFYERNKARPNVKYH